MAFAIWASLRRLRRRGNHGGRPTGSLGDRADLLGNVRRQRHVGVGRGVFGREAPFDAPQIPVIDHRARQEDADRARDIALALVSERIPARFGLNAMKDVQVVAPMHRGKAGVSRLNVTLQQRLNDVSGGRPVGDYMLRRGDRVIQQRNDYDREVFNGDVGRVAEAEGQGSLTVMFDGRRVEYDQEAARHLSLAYAISVHKSQGSEYPAVVVLLLTEHYPMLQRNLLYTALTRAKKLAVLVGSRRAVRRAVTNAAPMRRCSRLARRLSEQPTLPGSSS